ncbi:MAG: hypothetical protein ACI841_003359 [Planctomycetota bacterium]|jgi:hypothetical protein
MASETKTSTPMKFEGLDEPLLEQLPTFEIFFKTFGFKRIHGRVWGLLVLAGQPLSSKQVASELAISQGATSTCVSELSEWGAITSSFDSSRRCHLHSPVGNTLRIAATVLRRREQVIFGQFKQGATKTLNYVQERYGERDPRAITLRSIISSCEIAEAIMQMVFTSVAGALGDPESLLSRAIGTAMKIGAIPVKALGRSNGGPGFAEIQDALRSAPAPTLHMNDMSESGELLHEDEFDEEQETAEALDSHSEEDTQRSSNGQPNTSSTLEKNARHG